MKGKKKQEKIETPDELKDMVKALDELPTDVLKQLLQNLEDIEKYNKEHPEELNDDNDDK